MTSHKDICVSLFVEQTYHPVQYPQFSPQSVLLFNMVTELKSLHILMPQSDWWRNMVLHRRQWKMDRNLLGCRSGLTALVQDKLWTLRWDKSSDSRHCHLIGFGGRIGMSDCNTGFKWGSGANSKRNHQVGFCFLYSLYFMLNHSQ